MRNQISSFIKKPRFSGKSWTKIVFSSFFLFPFFLSHINAQVLEIEASANKSNVLTCEGFTYSLKYKCASTTTNCPAVTMTASAPSGIIFPSQSIGLTSDIASYSFSPDLRTVTFTFFDPLIAGNTGIIEIQATGECGLPEGTVGTMTASIASSGVTQATAMVNTTLHSTNKFCPQKAHGRGLALDNPTDYDLSLRFDGGYGTNGIGTTSVKNVVLTDMLPANALINYVNVVITDGNPAPVIPSNVCVIDNTPSAPKVTCTFPSDAFDIKGRYAPAVKVTVNVTYPSGSFSAGQDVTNISQVQYTPLGGSTVTVTNGNVVNYLSGQNYGATTPGYCVDELNVTDPLQAPNPELSLIKSGPATIKPGELPRYEFNAFNTGNVPLSNVIIEDNIPSDVKVYSIGGFSSTTNLTGSEVITYWITTTANPVYTQITIPYASQPTDPDITGIQVHISSFPSGGKLQYMPVYFTLQPGTTATSIQNCLTGSATNPGTAVVATNACTTAAVLPLDNFSTLAIQKYIGYAPNSPYAIWYGAAQNIGTIAYCSMFIENKGGGQPLQNPVVMDLLPLGLTFDNNPGDIIYGNSSCNFGPADVVEVIPNYHGTGRTLVRLKWNTPLPSGCNFWVSLKTKINHLAVAGNVGLVYPGNPYDAPAGLKNASFITGSSPATCYRSNIYNPMSYYATLDSFDLDGDGMTTNDTLCFASFYQGVNAQAQLESVKWVKGSCDSVYTKYPAHGKTFPGGLANYKLIVTNNGNVPATQFEILDILPFVGDMGVIDLNARVTQWRPNLVTPVYTPGSTTVYYSTSPNPCRTDFVPAGPAGCTAADWTTILPADPTTIQSLKFDFGSLVLNPGDQVELTWDMRAPVTAPSNGEIAWNSFAYKAIRVDNNDNFLPSEPFKVGIETKPIQPGTYGNYVWCDTNGNGIQDGSESGLDGIRVELYQDNGDGVANPNTDILTSFTSTANGGYYLFPGLLPANYYAVFYINPGATSAPANTTSDDLDSDGIPSTYNGLRVAITPITGIDAMETDLSWDFGLVCNNKAALGNYVWYDENQNNIQDEPAANGINGIVVKLYTGAGTLVATDTTANDIYGLPGYYLFDMLTPGDYYVEFGLTNGKTFTPNTGTTGGSATDPTDSDPSSTTGRTDIITLTAGQVDLTWDAGVVIPTGPYKLGNFVWFDTDNNGIYDAGESGINNVVVNLYQDVNNDNKPQAEEFVSSTTTVTLSGLDGIYYFDNLPSGNYIVQIPEQNFSNALNNYTTSTGNDPAGDPDNNIENDDNGYYATGCGVISYPITLGNTAEPVDGGFTNPTVDFGFYIPPPCDITQINATPGTCNPADNTYSVSGNLSFVNPPANGALIVSIDGNSVLLNAPFTSPLSYNINGLTGDGAIHTVTAVYSDDPNCSMTTTFTAPAACTPLCPPVNCVGVTVHRN